MIPTVETVFPIRPARVVSYHLGGFALRQHSQETRGFMDAGIIHFQVIPGKTGL